ncbi:hypothetical protein PIB30_078617, partial [Stylosanthes scabra]|nr:hypothetical protein [Stylosanthes scabra]
MDIRGRIVGEREWHRSRDPLELVDLGINNGEWRKKFYLVIVLVNISRFKDPRTLTPRGVVPNMPPPDCLVPYIRKAVYGGPLEMRAFDYDMPLVSALVEMWRTETHSFLLPWGECTITLWPRNFLADVPRQARGRITLGENDLAEVASPVDPAGRRTPRCVAAICPLLHYDVIGGALFPDKTNNHLCIASRRDNLEMSGCLPLVISWIYQRFPSFCPPSRDLLCFPLVSRLNDLGQTSRDTYTRRMLDLRNELD